MKRYFKLLSTGANLLVLSHAVGPAAATPFLDPHYTWVKTENIVYKSAAVNSTTTPTTKNLLLDVYEPDGIDFPGPLPAFVFVHGGGYEGGTRDEGRTTNFNEEFTRRGYVTITIDYRLIGDDPPVGARTGTGCHGA
ncbi:MAG: carboxylesterase family protein [Bdellovibrionaceae bacterium]|nr:carboxylesterase family protein [Pseudobdellovibrionaceae bacterium]